MVCNFIDNFSYFNTQLLSDEKTKVTINKYLKMIFYFNFKNYLNYFRPAFLIPFNKISFTSWLIPGTTFS